MQKFFTFLTYSGISTILFLMLLLVRNWKKQKATRILSMILFGFLFLFLTYATLYLKWELWETVVLPIGIIIPFALGPLIFEYIRTVYTSKIDYRKLGINLIPFSLAFLAYSIPHFILGMDLNRKAPFFRLVAFSIPFLGVLWLTFYLYISYKLLKRFKNLVKNSYSNLRSLDLKWLTIWIRGFTLFLIIDLISGLLIVASPDSFTIIYSNLFYLVFLIWYMGYYGINQTQVFLGGDLSKKPMKEENSPKKNVAPISNFNCRSVEFTELKVRLEILFSEQEIFKEQHLTLKETAETLGVTDKKLSYLLNVCMKSNFYEYVNTHRIDYFKLRLKSGDAKELTLLAIAFDSGFNSKATFNRVFKQQTGITPLQYKKTIE